MINAAQDLDKRVTPVLRSPVDQSRLMFLLDSGFWTRWAIRLIGAGGGFAACALGLLCVFQEKLIYVPRLPGLPKGFSYLPNRFGLQYEDIELSAADGTILHAWWMWPTTWSKTQIRQRPTVCFFQENAGDMSLRLPFLRLLMQHLNCSLFAPSYRGYGLSKGSPNEAGLKLDAQAALDWLQASKDVSQGQIALFGRSLGGAVAIYLAASNPQAVKAVMIENTFTSIEEVAPKVMPLLRPFLGPGRPFNFLIRNKWRSGQQMHKLRQLPVLLLSSLQDEMLPPEQMRQLYNSISSSGNATWAEFPQAGHMDAYETQPLEYWQAIKQFADAHLGRAPAQLRDSGAGVQEAQRADQAGAKPLAAAGPVQVESSHSRPQTLRSRPAAAGQQHARADSQESLSEWHDISEQETAH